MDGKGALNQSINQNLRVGVWNGVEQSKVFTTFLTFRGGGGGVRVGSVYHRVIPETIYGINFTIILCWSIKFQERWMRELICIFSDWLIDWLFCQVLASVSFFAAFKPRFHFQLIGHRPRKDCCLFLLHPRDHRHVQSTAKTDAQRDRTLSRLLPVRGISSHDGARGRKVGTAKADRTRSHPHQRGHRRTVRQSQRSAPGLHFQPEIGRIFFDVRHGVHHSVRVPSIEGHFRDRPTPGMGAAGGKDAGAV